jgi:hypothetical protein
LPIRLDTPFVAAAVALLRPLNDRRRSRIEQAVPNLAEMEILPLIATAVLATTVVLLAWRLWRPRRRSGDRRNSVRDTVDTVAGWPPEMARVLTISERAGYDLLRRAMPGFPVLAQVPLSRFLRVRARHSYSVWLQRVGSLSADLLLCDAGSRVLAVFDIRALKESERCRRRHERMARVLDAAGIKVYTWREGELPTASELRSSLAALLGPAGVGINASASRPMSLSALPEVSDVLAEGDRAAREASMEPVPSGFYEELEVAVVPR